LAPDQILHAPEAAARQYGPFALVIHVDNPFEVAAAADFSPRTRS
jgi:hypothetical protein